MFLVWSQLLGRAFVVAEAVKENSGEGCGLANVSPGNMADADEDARDIISLYIIKAGKKVFS